MVTALVDFKGFPLEQPALLKESILIACIIQCFEAFCDLLFAQISSQNLVQITSASIGCDLLRNR